MKLRSLHVEGFGRITDRTFTFGDGLNVVVGPNEAGKSTLAAAIVASLYGLQSGEKKSRKPWDDTVPFGTRLIYETDDGKTWEVHRRFDADSKGIQVYDGAGNDAAATIGSGRSLIPGLAHLRVPHAVFVQTACVRQGAIALDGASAAGVAASLAQALDGGPKEDAALGALARLDTALRDYVGTERAHKNNPLKRLREREREQTGVAEEARRSLDRLADLRERIRSAKAEQGHDMSARAELDRRVSALRAAHLRERLAALKEYRNDVSALRNERDALDDVAAFPLDRVADFDDAYHAWKAAESAADAAAQSGGDEALTAQERHELDERRADAGSLDEVTFEALRAASAAADAARARAAAAATEAAATRRDGNAAPSLGGAVTLAGIAALAAAVGVAVAHLWLWTALASVVAIVLGIVAFAQSRERAARVREADEKQRVADALLTEERNASQAVASILQPLRVSTLDELAQRRSRFAALTARAASAQRAHDRARTMRERADAEAERFDALARMLAPTDAATEGRYRDRDALRDRVHELAARRRRRDGLDAGIAMLAVRRAEILAGDDDFALQSEYAKLLAAGVDPAADDEPSLLRELERERSELETRANERARRIAGLEGELRAAEAAIPAVAELDEELARTRAEIARLTAFKRAVERACATIAQRKDEAHRAFARRLEEYSGPVLSAITAGRYAEIFFDPASLAVRVRIPETGLIEDLDQLSSGTRDQIALVVRFATARMFAEGLETPPLLLDDPFAFWDDSRIERCLPILLHAASTTQCVVFTCSAALAECGEANGALRIDVGAQRGATARARSNAAAV